jgi:GntR family transcriptional regulator, transcriptional repressor for pyruvate dehydrogenase complex
MLHSDVTIDEFDEADVRFHLALVASSPNEAMHAIMLAVRDAMAEHLRDALRQIPDRRPAFSEIARQHAAILEAVESGRGEDAASMLRAHVTDFYDRFIRSGADA